MVHALPVLEKLRSRYPRARIDWLITPDNAPLVRGHPALSNILLFPRRDFPSPAAGPPHWRPCCALSAICARPATTPSSTFTASSAPPSSPSPAARRFASGLIVPSRAVPASFRASRSKTSPPAAGPARGRAPGSHTTIAFPSRPWRFTRWTATCGSASSSASTPPLRFSNLPVSSEAEVRVSALLSEHTGQPLALLAPGTLWETKQWTAEGFAAVAQQLAEDGLAPLLIGSKSDQPLGRFIRSRTPACIDLTGQTDLAEAVALIRHAAIVVTNDSGLMHIAAALGKPAVSNLRPHQSRPGGSLWPARLRRPPRSPLLPLQLQASRPMPQRPRLHA